MTTYRLGIGDYGASRTPGDRLITYALGSCVALLLYEPQSGAVGMAHIALPQPGGADTHRPAPGYYASDAVPALIRELQRLSGAPPASFITKIVGGAHVIGGMTGFNIGRRNVLAVRKLLWRYGLAPRAEDTGGDRSRTVRVDVADPSVVVTNPEHGTWTV